MAMWLRWTVGFLVCHRNVQPGDLPWTFQYLFTNAKKPLLVTSSLGEENQQADVERSSFKTLY